MIYPQMCNEAEKRQNTTTAAVINAATSLYPLIEDEPYNKFYELQFNSV